MRWRKIENVIGFIVGVMLDDGDAESAKFDEDYNA